MEFAGWLFEARKEADLTQEALAERVGCSKSYISMLERAAKHPTSGGEIRPAENLVDALADTLNRPRAEARLAAGYAPARYGLDADTQDDREFKRLIRSIPAAKRPGFMRAVRAIADAVITV